jgi:hypothetical protein
MSSISIFRFVYLFLFFLLKTNSLDVVSIGRPYYVLTPNASGEVGIPDQSMLVINVSLSDGGSILRGYNAWQHTDLVINGSSLLDVVPSRPLPKVTASWDIEAAFQEGNLIHGIMHREHGWLKNGTYKYYGYVTYARSYDFGLTYTPWPNTGNINDSIILTSEGPLDIGGNSNTGTGPQWAVSRTDSNGTRMLYLYVQDAFARDHNDNFVFAYTVARAALGNGENALQWHKFYNNSWNEPPIGGRASAIANLTGAKMVFVEELDVWLAVDYSAYLMTSSDGMTWNPVAPQISLFPQRPVSQPESSYYEFSNILEYTSLVPGRGGNLLSSDDSLWLFYCIVRATDPGGWNGAIRGLVAVQLHIAYSATSSLDQNNKSSACPIFLVSLSQYISTSNNYSYWATVWPVDPLLFTPLIDTVVELFTSPAIAAPPGTLLSGLLDCVWIEKGTHFVARLGECGEVHEDGAYPPLVPPDGSTLTPGFLAALGWISNSSSTSFLPTGYKSVQLWRCFANGSFYSISGACAETDEDQTLLGWGLQKI